MKPRKDEDMKLSMENIKSLKELMGDAAYYRWLSDKFPNLSNNNLLEQQAQLFAVQLKQEIIFLITIYRRISIYKAMLQESVERADNARTESYNKERDDLIIQLEQIATQEQKKIADLLRLQDDQKNQEKMNQLLAMMNRRVADLSLEIAQYKSIITRIDASIKKIDSQIERRIDAICSQAEMVANHVSGEDIQSKEDKKTLLSIINQLKIGKISVDEFMEKFKKISFQYVAEKPELMKHLAVINNERKEISNLRDVKDNLLEKKDKLEASLENKIKLMDKLQTATKILLENNSAKDSSKNSLKDIIKLDKDQLDKLAGTSKIFGMFAAAEEVNQNKREDDIKPENDVSLSALSQEVTSLIEEDDKSLVTSILDDFDNLDDFEAEPENDLKESLNLGDKNIVDLAAIPEKETTPSSFRR